MTTLIALLRAVNVGGTGKLPMADLRSMAEKVGFTEVRTYIQSGNLIFLTQEAPSAAKSLLEETLEAYAGKPVGVILRTAKELQHILEVNPFADAERSKVGVLFLDSPPSQNTIETAKGQVDEEIELGQSEIFIHYPSGMGRSKLRLMAMSNGTMRNINTVDKLAKIAAAA